MFVKYIEPVDTFEAFSNAIKHNARYMAIDRVGQRCVIAYSHSSLEQFCEKFMPDDVYTVYFQDQNDVKNYWKEYQKACDYFDEIPF